MSAFSAGAKILGKVASEVASEVPTILRGSVKYMKEGGIIPSESRSGQLSFLPSDYGRAPKAVPPFSGGRRVTGRDPRAAVVGRARSEELLAKKRKAAAKDAIKQQDAMDVAKAAGQITDREIVKRNKILMGRRKAAGI